MILTRLRESARMRRYLTQARKAVESLLEHLPTEEAGSPKTGSQAQSPVQNSPGTFVWRPPQTMSELQSEVARLREALNISNPLIGLDFSPSLDLRPRWGFSRPLHSELARMMTESAPAFAATLRTISGMSDFFRTIPMEQDPRSDHQPAWTNPQINPLDAASICAMLTSTRPQRYIEIGSGWSTRFVAETKRSFGLATHLTSIDPCPRAFVDTVCEKVIRAGLETCDLEVFEALRPGDMVFLDGSHRSFMNSDVTVFVLDVLPFLPPGVLVGIHDIHWPYDYSPLFTDWYWNEQYILGAYLIGARGRTEIRFSTRFAGDQSKLSEELAPILEWWQGPRAGWLGGGALWFTKS